MLVELDAFFLKDILWVPPSSPLNVYRLVLWWVICMPGLRDFYAFTADPTVRRVGGSCWLMLAAMVVEFLLVVKWGVMHHYAGRTPPPSVVNTWAVVLLVGGFLATLWFGWLLPRIVRATEPGAEPDISLPNVVAHTGWWPATAAPSTRRQAEAAARVNAVEPAARKRRAVR